MRAWDLAGLIGKHVRVERRAHELELEQHPDEEIIGGEGVIVKISDDVSHVGPVLFFDDGQAQRVDPRYSFTICDDPDRRSDQSLFK